MFVLLSTTLCLLAADVPLSWVAPTTNEDGTKLVDLAGYKVYYGKTTRSYKQEYGSGIDVGNVLSYTVTNRKDGTWFFTITAYDNTGQESAYSNEITKEVDGKPTPPVLLDWKSNDRK